MKMANSRPSPGKQLVFDCRYGWIYDEWREPAAIAHLGGRGMFSIVPITAAALRKTVSTVALRQRQTGAGTTCPCLLEGKEFGCGSTILKYLRLRRGFVLWANIAADVVAGVLKHPPTIKSIQSNLQQFSVKVERSLKTCCMKLLPHPPVTSLNIDSDLPDLEELTESQCTSPNFGEAIHECRQKVTFKFEILQNNVGIVRPVPCSMI
ncbi:hypothetical protein L7F22_067137 [Adiantum nelumboides]|nr:hypothetical protein [Adiantum nelumboides]MCO5612866.1 hypothetical protein [Adiantum nelumboides]